MPLTMFVPSNPIFLLALTLPAPERIHAEGHLGHWIETTWDLAAELLLNAAETREEDDIEAATAQMERALRVEGWL